VTPPSAWDAGAFRSSVQSVLDGVVAERAAVLEPLGPDAALLLDGARAAVGGGKRLRASFCWWGFRAVRPDVPDEEALLRAAAALELLHASALVHDDFLDASDTRRGRPATHRSFERLHRDRGWAGRSELYGAGAAILLGDLLLCWSDELLRRCGLPAPAVEAAMRFFDTTRTEVIAGQFLDLSVQARAESDVEQAMRVLRYKSAKYSIERPLHVGAALAGASGSMLDSLTGFGLPLGEAFQLRDDLLGVYGDPAVTGKPAGDDLTEGKRTVLVALALRAAPRDEAALLDRSLGAPLDEAQVQQLRQVIDDCGARADVERRIDALTGRALEALAGAPVSEVAREALRRLAEAATHRAG
jgi:geranylgeranyl diphosphate synthase, type I